MVPHVQELGTWGADGGERALFHDVPHSQWPLGVPGPGIGTTDPSPHGRGLVASAEKREHWSLSSLSPAATSLQRNPVCGANAVLPTLDLEM